MALLRATKLSKVFGGLKAVSNFDVTIEKGELVGLIGPNGAGKTTAFNLLTGVYEPTTGEIELDGKSVIGLKPYQITQKGLARTFQNIRLFAELSVLDNIKKIAYHFHVKYGLLESVFRMAVSTKKKLKSRQKPLNFLKSLNLMGRKMRLPKTCLMASSAVWRLRGLWQLSLNFFLMNQLQG